MNILFTNYCNQRCPYCFAAHKLDYDRADKKSYISAENLKTVIDFCKKSNNRDIGILGGEPTLHPDFAGAIKMMMREGMNFSIFSNGIIREKKILLLLKGIDLNRCTIVININTEDSYAEGDYAQVKNTLKTLHEKIFLGFNIFREDFEAQF